MPIDLSTLLEYPITATALLPYTFFSYLETPEFTHDSFEGCIERHDIPGVLRLSLMTYLATIPKPIHRQSLIALQTRLAPLGYQTLIVAEDPRDFSHTFGMSFCQAEKQYRDLALLVLFKAKQPFSLLWVRETNGANYDLTTQTIIDKLRTWQQLCEFYLIGASVDWVELCFSTLPIDLMQFSEDINQFCPDILEQGLLKPIPENLSEQERFLFLEYALETQTIEDLANYLQRKQQLFLWWD